VVVKKLRYNLSVVASLLCAARSPRCNRFVWLINAPLWPRGHAEGVPRCSLNSGSGAGALEFSRGPFWTPAGSSRRLAIPAAIIATGASSAMSKRTLADTIPTSYGTRYVFVV
jgi:hypothetical protein